MTAPVAMVAGVAAVIAGRVATRTRGAPSTTTGRDLFVGQVLTVARTDEHGGQAMAEGAWWNLRHPAGPLEQGMRVRVVDVDGLHLVVSTDFASTDPQPQGAS